jgi:hypothetical protein
MAVAFAAAFGLFVLAQKARHITNTWLAEVEAELMLVQKARKASRERL